MKKHCIGLNSLRKEIFLRDETRRMKDEAGRMKDEIGKLKNDANELIAILVTCVKNVKSRGKK